MIIIDSLPHTFTMPITLAAWLVCSSGAAYADAPQLETFTKPTELVLTLSDDLPPSEDSQLTPGVAHLSSRSNADKFSTGKNQKRALNMDCGMDTGPNGDTGSSITSRLSGVCDLKYSY